MPYCGRNEFNMKDGKYINAHQQRMFEQEQKYSNSLSSGYRGWTNRATFMVMWWCGDSLSKLDDVRCLRDKLDKEHDAILQDADWRKRMWGDLCSYSEVNWTEIEQHFTKQEAICRGQLERD